jgi:chemotaxis protein CheX
MQAEFINPMLASVVNVLKTMAGIEPQPGKPFLKRRPDLSQGDVTGVVGLTGPVQGSLAVSFSESAIVYIVTQMLGEVCTEINGDVQDAVGELSNMISGDARRALADKGYTFQGALPTVISGRRHEITHALSGPAIVMPFRLGEHGTFFVEVCFEQSVATGRT